MTKRLALLLFLVTAAAGHGARAQDDGCNAVGNLDTLNSDVSALEGIAPHLRSERATELLGHTGFMQDALNAQGGSVLFGMNQQVLKDFIADRERILISVADGNWAAVQGEIGSKAYQQQAALLDVIQDALRCNPEEEKKPENSEETAAEKKAAEEAKKEAEKLAKIADPKKAGSLQALSAYGSSIIGSENRIFQLIVLIVLIVIAAGLLIYAYKFLRKLVRAEGRRFQRYYCAMEGELTCPDTSRPVTVVEVSRSGAKIASEALPEPGTYVTLEMPDHQIKARVVWSNSNYAGLAFAKLISIKVEDFRVEDYVSETEDVEADAMPQSDPIQT